MVEKKRLGMILGIVSLVLLVIVVTFIFMPRFTMQYKMPAEEKEAKVWADLDAMRTAGEMYFAKGKAERGVAEKVTPIAPSLAERKIIRTADLSLEVKKYDEAYQEIAKIVKELRGFIHHSSKEVAPDGWTRGTVIIRILPIKFDLTIERIAKLGRVERQEVSGRDVTEEYVDLKARLSNAYKVRARLRAILEEKAKKVADILEVEKELERVGENIERLEGKLRYLRDQVDLSTITIRLHEPKKVIRVELGFLKRLKNAFTAALNVFTQVFTGIIVFLGGLIGILVYGVVIVVIILVIRKMVRKRKGK